MHETNKCISIDVGIKNLAYCLIDYDNMPHTSDVCKCKILDWNVFSFYTDPTDFEEKEKEKEKEKDKKKEKEKEKEKGKSVAKKDKLSLVDIGIQLKIWFDYLRFNENVKKVIIENQIAPIASNMKSIQCMIAQYFIMNGVHDVFFISAHEKLKPFSLSKKLSYKERKKMGIVHCKDLIQQSELNSEWVLFFEKHKKKDDLADSFLQMYSYIYKNDSH